MNVELTEALGCLFTSSVEILAVMEDGFPRLVADHGGELWRQLLGGVVVDDGLFDALDWQHGKVADALLLHSADEVTVVAAVTLRFGEDEACPGPAVLEAPLAEQLAAEVVGRDTVSAPATGAGSEYVLDDLKGCGIDDGLVAPGVLLALVGNKSDVIRVSKDGAQLVLRRCLFGPPFGGACCQPDAFSLLVKVCDAVLIRGEQLEHAAHQWPALRIEHNRADGSTLELLDAVQVADAGAADRAALDRLLTHLVPDVSTALLGLVLINGMHDRLDHCAFWALA